MMQSHSFRFFSKPRANANASAGFMICNGRRIAIDSAISGGKLAALATGGDPCHIPVLTADRRTSPVEPGILCRPEDFRDGATPLARLEGIPERGKGASLYAGSRDDFSKAVVSEQVHDLALKYVKGNIDFDEENADWMVIPHFHMPPAWNVRTAPLMIVFPRDYPVTPPIGFYLPDWLQSPNGHFYGQAYHGAEAAPTFEHWNWYCCYVNPGSWQPAPVRFSGDWRRGDNLWTYITLINEVLTSPADAS